MKQILVYILFLLSFSFAFAQQDVRLDSIQFRGIMQVGDVANTVPITRTLDVLGDFESRIAGYNKINGQATTSEFTNKYYAGDYYLANNFEAYNGILEGSKGNGPEPYLLALDITNNRKNYIGINSNSVQIYSKDLFNNNTIISLIPGFVGLESDNDMLIRAGGNMDIESDSITLDYAPQTDNAQDKILVRRATDGLLMQRDASSLVGGGVPSTNLATADQVATGNRLHLWNNFNLTIRDINRLNIFSSAATIYAENTATIVSNNRLSLEGKTGVDIKTPAVAAGTDVTGKVLTAQNATGRVEYKGISEIANNMTLNTPTATGSFIGETVLTVVYDLNDPTKYNPTTGVLTHNLNAKYYIETRFVLKPTRFGQEFAAARNLWSNNYTPTANTLEDLNNYFSPSLGVDFYKDNYIIISYVPN